MKFAQTAEFDWLPWQPKRLICETISKKHILRSHKENEAETL